MSCLAIPVQSVGVTGKLQRESGVSHVIAEKVTLDEN